MTCLVCPLPRLVPHLLGAEDQDERHQRERVHGDREPDDHKVEYHIPLLTQLRGDPHDQSRGKPAPSLTTSTARSAALTNRPGTSKAPSRSTTADGGVEAVIATWQLRCLAEGCLARALDVPHQSWLCPDRVYGIIRGLGAPRCAYPPGRWAGNGRAWLPPRWADRAGLSERGDASAPRSRQDMAIGPRGRTGRI